uniref:RING-type E3 ubiquitin transferase n=1 Tax=Pogona vitticeps TaxID=103695 RepID=A0ABM5FHD2_9SAUR
MEAEKGNLSLPADEVFMVAAADAATDPVQDLYEEATCSICLEYFKSPVITECGHNFCQACLTQFWEEVDKEASCPQCREKIQQGNLRPNRKLANFVEITKKLSLQKAKVGERRRVCEKHQEPLKLFCKEDQALICVVCDRSKEHRNHDVVPLEEAAQDYKDLICSQLELLKKKKERTLACKSKTEAECQNMLRCTKEKTRQAVEEFRQMRHFLEEQEKILLAQLKVVEKEIASKRDELLARFSEELSSLGGLIQEVEEKQQQPPEELLQGRIPRKTATENGRPLEDLHWTDVKNILEKNGKRRKFEVLVGFPVELKWKIWDFCDSILCPVGPMELFKDAVLSRQELQKANIFLDLNTAHQQLILTEDCKSVKYGGKCQDLPVNPERFSRSPSVLGSKGFTGGRHFWEVVVGSEEQWIIGVAKKSMKRKGDLVYSPRGGLWAIGKWGGGYNATNESHFPRLSPVGELKLIRVYLNYAGGQVAFYDADTAAHLYTFSRALFAGETLFPFFHIYGKGHLRISP